MVNAKAPTQSYSTSQTVSAPLDLDTLHPKGEHQTVQLSSTKSKQIRPKPKITLTCLTPNNSGTLKKINSVVIPVVYSDRFYKDVLDPQLDDVNKLVYYGDIPVGAICCRFDNLGSSSKDKVPTLVILTLAVLAPYRSQSLGSALLLNTLQSILNPTPQPVATTSKSDTNTKPTTRSAAAAPTVRKVVTRAMAHVQVGNEGGIRFYERLGFKVGETVKDYYSKMEPRDAVLMVCEDVRVALGESAAKA